MGTGCRRIKTDIRAFLGRGTFVSLLHISLILSLFLRHRYLFRTLIVLREHNRQKKTCMNGSSSALSLARTVKHTIFSHAKTMKSWESLSGVKHGWLFGKRSLSV